MPVLTDEEVNTVRESCRQLGAIGRNLNQVARALNIEFRESDKLKQEAIEKLAERIGSVAKIVKLEHAWRRLDGRNDDGFQVAPFPG
ncbi:MobC family plasmid mobilization relaxosome protein [Klebsiella pneumoniae]|uniref:plasmid mobilization relaxosome protein MobC n=1 Tax=Enterobacteriaceae TaxID=543 RepID=UPI001CE3C0C1|nr:MULTISPECIES: plasmid mobilization relaxosome protein MobC [Enterobacteriaceae]MCJ3354166.1 MobC family plasmid mobilization relaxosome protein [Klebsiella pneumoniae]MCJ3381725.1 MobC family plasmid mobilization relaxosome protein [Klebsiella pneumoniae]MDQ6166753.1 MobC family plasmid mobilization relaxosome protein [Klebsiella pneumoniae]WOJ28604.1 plasmid mobilization relaxosome protein MobC [Citrobacter koseri]